MLEIPKRPAKKRRANEYLDVVEPILVAFNSISGVWACFNRVIRMPVISSTGVDTWINAGLGTGSADIIFSAEYLTGIARIGWLECKSLSKRTTTKSHAARDEAQASWAAAMRRKGHFVAHGIATVDEARAALDRCRNGYLQ